MPEIECFDVNPKKYEMVEDMAELTYLNDATVRTKKKKEEKTKKKKERGRKKRKKEGK